jgi:hypothetical protein
VLSDRNEKGKIDSVRILQGYSEVYDKEAIRVIKSIPEWDVIYRHGKLSTTIWSYPVRFDWTNRKKKTV